MKIILLVPVLMVAMIASVSPAVASEATSTQYLPVSNKCEKILGSFNWSRAHKAGCVGKNLPNVKPKHYRSDSDFCLKSGEVGETLTSPVYKRYRTAYRKIVPKINRANNNLMEARILFAEHYNSESNNRKVKKRNRVLKRNLTVAQRKVKRFKKQRRKTVEPLEVKLHAVNTVLYSEGCLETPTYKSGAKLLDAKRNQLNSYMDELIKFHHSISRSSGIR